MPSSNNPSHKLPIVAGVQSDHPLVYVNLCNSDINMDTKPIKNGLAFLQAILDEIVTGNGFYNEKNISIVNVYDSTMSIQKISDYKLSYLLKRCISLKELLIASRKNTQLSNEEIKNNWYLLEQAINLITQITRTITLIKKTNKSVDISWQPNDRSKVRVAVAFHGDMEDKVNDHLNFVTALVDHTLKGQGYFNGHPIFVVEFDKETSTSFLDSKREKLEYALWHLDNPLLLNERDIVITEKYESLVQRIEHYFNNVGFHLSSSYKIVGIPALEHGALGEPYMGSYVEREKIKFSSIEYVEGEESKNTRALDILRIMNQTDNRSSSPIAASTRGPSPCSDVSSEGGSSRSRMTSPTSEPICLSQLTSVFFYDAGCIRNNQATGESKNNNAASCAP